MSQAWRLLLPALTLVLGASIAEAQVLVTKGTNFSVDVAADGRIATDLMGELWTITPGGGDATAIVSGPFSVKRPRFSPNGSSIVYERQTEGRNELWQFGFDEGEAGRLGYGMYFDRQPAWHPDGRRIVFSSDRRDSGFDLWEIDLATQLEWRVTHQTGDESEPAWSANGRDLVYVHHEDDLWSLILRRLGQPDRVLLTSRERISSPAWRPDGSLITFLRHSEDGYSIDMVILSDPLLVRQIIGGEDFFVAPIAWADRQRMLYTANGVIRTRAFNSWNSKTLPFRAWVQRDKQAKRKARPKRRLPAIEQPAGKLVVRTARLFDGIGGGYREGLDIIIDGGKIIAVEERRDRPDAIVVDLGDLTALPGFIDSDAALPPDSGPPLGPLLLSFGVTTIVVENDNAGELDKLWAGKVMPGPRVLGARWQISLDSLASIIPGTDAFPVSPAGIRYENAQIADDGEPGMVLSSLADSRTAGLQDLLRSRQANLIGIHLATARRFIDKPLLGAQSPPIVLGSRASGLPPGVAQHAEFRALAEAGLSAEKILRSAGINAASALGLGLQIGRIAPGASADLVIVDGDPLGDIFDAQQVVGVVRNGRFYSAIGLLERVKTPETVE